MTEIKVKYSDYVNRLSFKNKAGRAIWNLTYLLFFRPLPFKYFNIWRILLLKIFGAKIGKNCTVASSAKIWAPWKLIMHDHSLIAQEVNCYNPDFIILKTQTVISQFSFLCTASHDISKSNIPLITKPIIIEDQAWVAADAFIGPGVTIGQGAVVAARAVVVKDVEPWSVVGGNPAKYLKKREIIN